MDKEKMARMYGKDKVKNVWVATDCAKLADKVKRRDATAMKLEGAETKLIQKANGARLKAIKKSKGNVDAGILDPGNEEAGDESGSVAARWIRPKDRPTHRLKPLIGKKVDTIDWCRAEVERLGEKIDALQAEHHAGEATKLSSVFVEFYKQSDAQAAFQSLAHNQPLHMSPRYIGLEPTQVVWSNLKIRWWELVIRRIATLAFIVAMIIFWFIPVAFIGFVSNINTLENMSGMGWLHFLDNLPSQIMGVVTSLLPSVLLAVLMALVPIIMRSEYLFPPGVAARISS